MMDSPVDGDDFIVPYTKIHPALKIVAGQGANDVTRSVSEGVQLVCPRSFRPSLTLRGTGLFIFNGRRRWKW